MDDYCLLVAGAGAGKTTDDGRKGQVFGREKEYRSGGDHCNILYKIRRLGSCVIESIRDLVFQRRSARSMLSRMILLKQFSAEPPEINFSSQQIIFDMLEKSIFHNKQLMRNLVLFLGYYFGPVRGCLQIYGFESIPSLQSKHKTLKTLKSWIGRVHQKS